jgi:hypothetical protein
MPLFKKRPPAREENLPTFAYFACFAVQRTWFATGFICVQAKVVMLAM